MSAQAWVFQRGVLWAMDFADATPAQLSARVAVRFAEVTRSNNEPLARAMGMHASEVAQRLNTGRRCFAGWTANELVTYGWVSQRDEDVGELERVYQVQPDDAYIWHCATLPAQRGQGLYNALLSHITHSLRAEGMRRAWIGCNLENAPSLRAFAAVGFQRVIEVAYMRLFNLRCLWLFNDAVAPHELVRASHQMLIAPHERALRFVALGWRPQT